MGRGDAGQVGLTSGAGTGQGVVESRTEKRSMTATRRWRCDAAKRPHLQCLSYSCLWASPGPSTISTESVKTRLRTQSVVSGCVRQMFRAMSPS